MRLLLTIFGISWVGEEENFLVRELSMNLGKGRKILA
jgi:hypothetical protein